MLDKNFIRASNLKRYERMFEITKDYSWLVKHANEASQDGSSPMSFFDIPTVGEYAKYLVYGNTLPEEDVVQKRLGYVLSSGIANLYAEKDVLEEPALVSWKFDDPKKILSDAAQPVLSEDLTSIVMHAQSLLNPEKNSEDRKVKRLLSQPGVVQNGVRYAFVRAASPFYNYFVFKNPLVDFLPQDFGESEGQLAFDLPLTAAQMHKILVTATKTEKDDLSYLISTYKGPRLDDLELAYKIAQVRLLMSAGQVDEKQFAKLQLISDGQYLHVKQGLEALKRYMENEANRKERYKPSILFDYTVQKGDDLREIITQLDGNIQNVIRLNRERDPDFDIDSVEPGATIRMHARTELMTDNMFVGEIAAGRSYGSLNKALRRGRTSQIKKKELEVDDEDKIRGKFLYYKTWDGRPDFYTRPWPKSAYIFKGFIEDVIAKDPEAYKSQLTSRLLDSILSYIDYSLLTANESRNDIKQLAESLGGNTLAALNLYKDFLNGVKSAIVGTIEGMDPSTAYKDAVSDVRDSMIQKYRSYLTSIEGVYSGLTGLLPFSIATGDVSHVMNKDGSTKLKAGDLTKYYKEDLGGMQVLSVLENENGYLTEKYSRNERDYKKWLDQYGETNVTQSIQKVAEDKDKIDDAVLASVGIPPFGSADKKEFAKAIWKMCRDYPTLEALRERLGGVDERALFVYLEDRLLEAYPDIKEYISKKYDNLAIRGQQQVALQEEGEELTGGRGESRVERARRVLESGETDVVDYLTDVHNQRYKQFKLNGEVHTYAIGGYLQKRYSPTTGGRAFFKTFEVEEEKGVRALISAVKHNYGYNMGKYIADRNKADFKVYLNSRDLVKKDVMQTVGAFADPQVTYDNVVRQREAQEQIDAANKELAAFEGRDDLSPEEKRRKKNLNDVIAAANRIIRNNRYDTAHKAFDRSFSHIGRVPPYLMEEAIAEYFKNVRKLHTANNLGKLLVPFDKADPSTNDPFQHKDSPRKMSERQLLTLFDRSVNMESAITNPLQILSGQASSLIFGDKAEVKAFVKEVRSVLGRIERRPTLKIDNTLEDIRKLLTSLPKAQSQDEFDVIVQSIIQGLDLLRDTIVDIQESSQAEVQSWISEMPMAPEIAVSNKADVDELQVTSRATAYRYIQNLEMLSEDEKLELGSYALKKMSADQFVDTDTFMRNLLVSANKAGIAIERKEELVLAHDDVLDADALSDEEEIIAEIVEDNTGMKDRIELFMSKYGYLDEVSDNDIQAFDLQTLRSMLLVVNEAIDDGSAIISGLNDLNDQEYSVIEESADAAEEFSAGTLPSLKERLEEQIEAKMTELPVSRKEVEEVPPNEVVVEVGRDLPLADTEDVEILEDIPAEDFEILEELPLGIQFKPHPSYPLGLVSGETTAEGRDNWVYDEENNLRYNVNKNIEPGWHGIRWKEDIAQVEETPTEALGQIAEGLRGLLDTHDEILDQDESGSAYNNVLDFASKLDSLVNGIVISPEGLPTLTNMLTGIIRNPTANNVLGYFTSNNYQALLNYLNSIVQPRKTSSLKIESVSNDHFHRVIATVSDDRDFYYF